MQVRYIVCGVHTEWVEGLQGHIEVEVCRAWKEEAFNACQGSALPYFDIHPTTLGCSGSGAKRMMIDSV